MKTNKSSEKNDSIEENEIDDFEIFIRKKKAQTKVLKKIITKLDSEEEKKT